MKTCQHCGKEFDGAIAGGLCPECMLKVGLGSELDTKATTKTPVTPAGMLPDMTEVARHFPQLEILELLGQGGMGAVYKARQKQLDRIIALKILPPESGRDPAFAERFLREARALARLNHPNIVTVHEFGESDGLFYLVMEYVDGANLRQMERAGKLTPAEALAIVPKICDALQYAHEEGIVHRDIKPENILVDKKGRVKIADFGLAKLLGKAPTDFTLTGTHQAMGTPHYMAPEQMEKPLSVDHRADIYSLGVVFYEMLTGELPIGWFQPPSAKVHVDVRLDEVVLRSMEHDVERRYQHVSEVKTAVEGVTGTPQTPVAPPPVAVAKPSTNWVKVVLIVVGCLVAIPVVIGLLVLALFWTKPSSTRPPKPVVMSEVEESQAFRTLKSFTTADPTINKSVVVQGNDWFVDCKGPQTIQLFEIPNPGVENCTVKYRAALKAEGLQGRAYLEMWCRVPGKGEFFSKGLDKVVSGDKPWDTYEIPFYLKEGEKPDLLRLNLVVEGTGRVGIRKIEVRTNAKQVSAVPAPDQVAWTSLFNGKELGRWRVIEDPERPQASGKVRVENGQIVLGEENVRAMAGVGWTGEFPTMDYEVEWEGMVQKVKDAQRIVMFPVGRDLTGVGILGEAIDVKFGPVNGKPLEFSGATNQPPLLDGRWYPFRVRVSQAEGIGVWVDGRKVLSHRVTGFRFGGTMPAGPSVPKSLAFLIDGPSAGGVRNIRMRSLPPSATAKPTDLSPSEARALIPEAAGMSVADFQKLAGGGDANAAKFDSQSLSLVLLSLRMDDATKKSAAAMADFHYLNEAIHPAALAQAVSLSKNRGYASLIQPDFITDCTCSASEGAATGVVSFRAEGLYAGKIEFLARWNNGAWQIDEFRLPGYGIKTVRGDDGRWVKSALQSK